MKLADMIDLESIATSVQVQVLSPAPYENNNFDMLNIRVFFFFSGENVLFSYFWFGGIGKLGEVYQICASHLGIDDKIKQMFGFESQNIFYLLLFLLLTFIDLLLTLLYNIYEQ